MKPLALLPEAVAQSIVGVLFDLDDTVLTHGRLELEAYAALFSLRAAGLGLVAVTGRPSGWAEVLARQWPIDGVVAENGAVHVVRAGTGVDVRVRVDGSRRARLDALSAAVREAVPEAVPSDDADARRTDITWDIAERARLEEPQIRRILALAHAAGARTTRSSVHLHASFEPDDKASGAVRFLADRCGEDAGAALGRWAFVGDSANDAACFAAFHATFGVANVAASLGLLNMPPRWMASRERGAGFAEIAATLLERRSRGPVRTLAACRLRFC